MTIDPGPIDRSVLTEQVKHRSELLWNPGGQDPPGTLNCRCRHEELTRREPMVDERVIAIVRLLGLERLHMVPSIKIDHALITAFVERWRPETHSFHLPHGEMTITLQDVEVIMGMPIEGEAMVGCSKRTWKTVCNEMLGIQILDENKTVLDGQRIQIKALIDRIAQLLPPDANELQVHQYARCYVLALLGDMVFADKSGDRVHLMWLEFMENLHNPPKYSWGSAALSWLYRQLCKASEKTAKQIGGALILVQLWIYARFPHMSPQKVPPPEGVYGPPPSPIPFAMKWAGAKCTKSTPTHVLSAYRNQLAATRPDQVKWEPYADELSHLPPNFRIGESNMWRSKVPLICFWLVEFHLPNRALRQFGLKQEQPEDADTNRDLHKIDARGKVDKNWRVEHAGHIRKWNDRSEYVCHAERIEEVMSRHHPYMVWYRRITRLYIDRDSAKMEILIANQLAVLNWFNEDSEQYKFIKKALEDVDEVDRISVPASDEAANYTETPDVGPSTSSTPPVHTRCGLAPTPHLATETPDPPLSTPHDTTRPPMPPISPINTETPLWFTHAGFESSPHTTTVDHHSPTAPSYSSLQTVIPTLNPQTPQVELMSTSPSHTQLPPTSSSPLIHVAQATQPHDGHVEQEQSDQAEQPHDANDHAPPKRKSTRTIQPKRCGTGSHLVRAPNESLEQVAAPTDRNAHPTTKQYTRRDQKRSKRTEGAA